MSAWVKQSRAVQLGQRIAELIQQGQWEGGQRMPTVRELADRFGVSVTTTLGALKELEERGFVERRPRGRSFVKAGGVHDKARRAARSQPRHIAIIGAATPGPVTNDDNWTGHIMSAIASQIVADGRHFMTSIGSAERGLADYIDAVRTRIDDLASQLAGVILFGADQGAFYHPIVAHLDGLAVPWISISRPDGQVTHNHVSADDHGAGWIAGHALSAMGLTRVALLSPPFDWAHSFRQTALGLYDAFLHAGVDLAQVRQVVTRECDVEAGHQAMREHLRRHQPPQAIFATGDPIALGAMRACVEAGLSVPQSLAVISTTGLRLAEHCSPSLTVIPQPMERLGRQAVRRLLGMIDQSTTRVPGVRLAARMIVRESFRPDDAVRARLAAMGMIQKSRRRRRRSAAPPAPL